MDVRSLPPVVSWVAHRSVPSHIQNAGQRDLHKPQEADYEREYHCFCRIGCP
jgi:hypothetical protein